MNEWTKYPPNNLSQRCDLFGFQCDNRIANCWRWHAKTVKWIQHRFRLLYSFWPQLQFIHANWNRCNAQEMTSKTKQKKSKKSKKIQIEKRINEIKNANKMYGTSNWFGLLFFLSFSCHRCCYCFKTRANIHCYGNRWFSCVHFIFVVLHFIFFGVLFYVVLVHFNFLMCRNVVRSCCFPSA